MKHHGQIILSAWQWIAASLLAALFLAGLMALGRWWRRQRRSQDFLNIYEAKMRRAVHEGIDARAEVKAAPFQYEDLQQLESEAYLILGKAAGGLVSQIIKDFEAANQEILAVARQRKIAGAELQSAMWKEKLRTRIEMYSESLARFSDYEKALDELVAASRRDFFND